MRKLFTALAVAALMAPMAAHANHNMFAEADANKDGMISKAESVSYNDAMFAKKDANKDGMVSKAEAEAYMKNDKSMWRKAKDKMGMNHNANDTNSMSNNTTEVDKNQAR